MSLRRLHHEQPESFEFTKANASWVDRQIAKYPVGRQASAVIPLLWRAQEQEGWVSRPAIEEVARLLEMDPIRVLEVATFYFMFQLQPVGEVAHIQVCGTTSCMICGAEDLVAVCKEKIAPEPHQISEDGKFSWEEVECLGACANAPMAQIGKDYYEDLTVDSFRSMIDRFACGEVPSPGSQNGRYSSEPLGGLTSLKVAKAHDLNASRDIAKQLGDTVKRIDGMDPLPQWGAAAVTTPATTIEPAKQVAPSPPPPAESNKPELLAEARGGKGDDLKLIKGVGPKLEELCNGLGVWHFDQIASWTDAEVAWVDDNLEGFKGRILRDGWVAQAKILAAGGETDFSKAKR